MSIDDKVVTSILQHADSFMIAQFDSCGGGLNVSKLTKLVRFSVALRHLTLSSCEHLTAADIVEVCSASQTLIELKVAYHSQFALVTVRELFRVHSHMREITCEKCLKVSEATVVTLHRNEHT